jgi:hypothetical protein
MDFGILLVMKRIILLLMCVWSLAASAEVYKWVDEEGNVHYSDRADTAGDVTRLPAFQYKSPVPSSPPSQPRAPTPSTADQRQFEPDFPEEQQQLQPSRFIIRIASPAQDATVRDNQGIVPVAIQTTPQPGQGTLYQMYLDGKPWYQPFAGQRAYLSNVDRGTHTIHVVMLSSTGSKLGESNRVTFHLHRHSIKHPRPR